LLDILQLSYKIYKIMNYINTFTYLYLSWLTRLKNTLIENSMLKCRLSTLITLLSVAMMFDLVSIAKPAAAAGLTGSTDTH